MQKAEKRFPDKTPNFWAWVNQLEQLEAEQDALSNAMQELGEDFDADVAKAKIAGIEDVVTAMIVANEESLAWRMEWAASRAEELEFYAESERRRARLATEHARKLEAQAERIQGRMLAALDRIGADRVVTPLGTVCVHESESTEVFEGAEIPGEFARVKVEADKKKINKALKAGQELSFATIKRTRRVMVRK